MYGMNTMNDHAILYVPSDTPEAMALAPRKVAGEIGDGSEASIYANTGVGSISVMP